MNWNEIVDRITPYVVKVETPDGHGTGFLCLYNENREYCGIATAHHVVSHADYWHHAIRIHHYSTQNTAFFTESERVIIPDPGTDSAVILLSTAKVADFALPQDLIPLLPSDFALPIGVEVGWLGFPGIEPQTLCFFSGNISARKDSRRAYLIDGVAINGVSGGPVICCTIGGGGVQIVGAIMAYVANRAVSGSTLPGLSVAQDVSHFHSITSHIRTVDEARRQQIQQQQQPPDAPPMPEPLPALSQPPR